MVSTMCISLALLLRQSSGFWNDRRPGKQNLGYLMAPYLHYLWFVKYVERQVSTYDPGCAIILFAYTSAILLNHMQWWVVVSKAVSLKG